MILVSREIHDSHMKIFNVVLIILIIFSFHVDDEHSCVSRQHSQSAQSFK